MTESGLAEDLAAITQIINRYSLAMDSREWALMDEVFIPDAVIRMNGEPFEGRALGVGAIRIFIECCSLTHHMNSNIFVRELGNDRASVISNFRAWHRGIGERAEEVFDTMGTYEDELVRTAQGWRIAQRDERSPIVLGNYDFFDAAIPRIAALRGGEK